MLKSSEQEKLGCHSNYKSPKFQDQTEVNSVDPPIPFYYQILRIGGPENNVCKFSIFTVLHSLTSLNQGPLFLEFYGK